MKQMTAEELVSRGQKLLAKKDFKGAVKTFSAALEKEDVVPTRNNLAFALFRAGEARRALEVIEPAFNTEERDKGANPFTHALAAIISKKRKATTSGSSLSSRAIKLGKNMKQE